MKLPNNTIFNTYLSVNIFPCDSYSKDSTLLLENFYATFFKIFFNTCLFVQWYSSLSTVLLSSGKKCTISLATGLLDL